MKKNNNKNLNKRKNNNSKNQINSSIRLIIIVLIVFFSFYLLTIVLLESKDSKEDDKKISIQYDEILAGSTFNMYPEKYYVVFYDKSSEDATEISSSISQFEAKNNDIELFTVDLSNKLNKPVVNLDKVNKNPKNASELLINGPTIIKISNGKLDKYIYGEDECLHFLNK